MVWRNRVLVSFDSQDHNKIHEIMGIVHKALTESGYGWIDVSGLEREMRDGKPVQGFEIGIFHAQMENMQRES